MSVCWRMLLWMAAAGALPATAATCSVAASPLAFGSYQSNQAHAIDSAGSLTVSCTRAALDAAPVTVSYELDISRGGSGNFTNRELQSGASRLQYGIYRDPLRSIAWGDGSAGSARVSSSLTVSASLTATAVHTVYGRLFGRQNVIPGAYSDSITVTMNY